MFFLKVRKYIGVTLILILLFTQANPANAFYSPTMNTEATQIKKHLQTSKTKNGNGTLQQAYDKIGDRANQGFANLFTSSVKGGITKSLTNTFLDGLSLIFGRWIGTNASISNCLRDDLWELLALQEQVFDEVMRGAILGNLDDASILWNDYTNLSEFYYILRDDYKNGDLWFPKVKNYYVDCPYGEWTKAWADMKRALNSFRALGKGSIELGSFGSLAKVAEKRAVKRAQEWIKANQISLTIGGSQGSNPRDLMDKAGLGGLVADIKTELNFARSYGELIFVNLLKATLAAGQMAVDVYRWLTDSKSLGKNIYEDAPIGTKDMATIQRALKTKNIAVKQMETAIKFNLSLNNVAENELIEIDSVLGRTSDIIQSSYDTKFSQENLKTFCDKLNILPKIQCKNKSGGSFFSCNK